MPRFRRFGGLYSLLSLLLLVPPGVMAAEATFTVVDQQGQPLERAIVTISSASIAAESPPPVVHLMDQTDKRFVPDVIAINRGDSIRFPNSDDIRHHVYSFSVPKTFELPLYSGEPKNPMQFTEAGTVIVGCNIHDRMQGYIYIIDDARHALTVNGKASFSALPAEALTVTIYHPDAVTEPALRFQIPAGDIASTQPYRIELKATAAVDTTDMTDLEKKFLQLRHGAHPVQNSR